MPKFCANLKWLFTELPLLERFDAAARAGFEAVEYPTPYEQPATVLRARLRDCGLRQVLINTPAGDPARREQSGIACLLGRQAAFRDDWRRSLEYAVALECGQVQAGILPADVSHDHGWTTYLHNVSWAAGEAASAGIRLLVEPINQIDKPPASCCAPRRRAPPWSRPSGATRPASSSTSTTARSSRAASAAACRP